MRSTIDTLMPSMLIFSTLLSETAARRVIVSDASLRVGVLIDLAEPEAQVAAQDFEHQVLASAEALLARADTMAGKADDQLFGPDGLMRDGSASLRQLAALLGQARASWVRVDALLVDAQAVAANTRGASTDLGALRTEVDTSLRKIQQLLDEVNRKWPFARDTDLRLP